MRLILIALVLTLSACGPNSGSNSSTKPLFSQWVSSDGSKTLDLSELKYGGNMLYQQVGNTNCTMILVVNGDENFGTLEMINISYNYDLTPTIQCYAATYSRHYVRTPNGLRTCTGVEKYCTDYR